MAAECIHERDDLGYPIDPNMCDRCQALSKAMNDYHTQCVMQGFDPDRGSPPADKRNEDDN